MPASPAVNDRLTTPPPARDADTDAAAEEKPKPLPAHAASGRRFDIYRETLRELRRRQKQNEDPTDKPLPTDSLGRGMRLSRRRNKARQRSFWKLFSAFWHLMGGQRTRVVVAMALMGLATLVGLLPLYATKIVIDYVLDDKPRPEWLSWGLNTLNISNAPRALLIAVVTGMLICTVINIVVGVTGRWQATKVAKRTVVSARRTAFEHAVRLPLHRVYEIKSGGVASILRDDAGGVGELVFNLLYNPGRAIVQLLGSLIVLAMVDWRLLLGALGILPIVWVTHRTWISKIRPLWRDIRATRQMTDSHATETFGGMRVVRTFGRHKSEATHFTANNHLMARQELYTWWWMRGVDAAWQVIIPTATALLILYGGFQILSDQAAVDAALAAGQPALAAELEKQAMTAGDLVLFLAYLTALLGPIQVLATSATGLQNNLAGLDRTLDLLDEKPEFAPGPQAIVLDRRKVQGHITLDNVSFAYRVDSHELGDDEEAKLGAPVLDKVNLDVPPGMSVALVGPSGAGKTTLCNLVARFYDPTGGRILLDGRDLRDVHVDSYRSLLSIVEQDTFLFDGTIEENIRYGQRHATLEDVIRAARLANAHGFISGLPEGYDSIIGERGVKLSGGQRQRLTIARAILADPKILILDEATSNLDTESERLIQASLAELMRGRTSFIIAHRLSTIQHADLICVLEGGRVVETGNHDELMRQSGRYRRMVELQTEKHPLERQSEAATA